MTNIQKLASYLLAIFVAHEMAQPLLAGATAPDPKFAPRFEVSGAVVAAAAQPDNKVVVAGRFTSMNGVARNSLARLNADGTLDVSFQLTIDGYVSDWALNCVARQADGKILVGGRISIFLPGGSQRTSLVRLNANGSLDLSFDAGNWTNGGLDNTVSAIAATASGKILIGGEFTYQGKYNHFAQLNSDGKVDATFKSGAGADGNVLAIVLQPDGRILLGGQFSNYNGVKRPAFCRVNTDGSLDTTFLVGTGARGVVRSIALLPDRKVVLGGSFASVQDFNVSLVARLGTDGQVDKTFRIGADVYDVTQVLAEPDGGILVGGWRGGIIFGGQPTDHDACVISFGSNGAGRYARYFDGKRTDVLALARRPDGRVVCGGTFRSDSTRNPVRYAHGLALLENTLTFSAFNAAAGQTATVSSLFEQPDGKIIAVGNFNLVNGESQYYVARLNSDGAMDTSYRPAFTAKDELYYFPAAWLMDGRLLFAGRRITASGNFDSTYINAPYGTATAMTRQADGKVLVASLPTGADRGLTRLMPDGSRETSFNVAGGLTNSPQPGGTFGLIYCIAVQPDGRILIGGSFDKFNNQERVGIARLNSDGALDTAFTPAAPRSSSPWTPASVQALLPQSDGKVIVGGYFSQVGGIDRSSLARLNSDGSADAAFTSPFRKLAGTVYVLAHYSDGSVLVGGQFQVSGEGGAFYNAFARLESECARDATFAPSFDGISPEVRSFLTTKSGQVLVAGTFNSVSGTPRQSMAQFTLPPLPPRLRIIRLAGQNIQLTWPSSAVNYVLESSPRLGVGVQWTPVVGQAFQTDGSRMLTNQASEVTRFFRLRQ